MLCGDLKSLSSRCPEFQSRFAKSIHGTPMDLRQFNATTIRKKHKVLAARSVQHVSVNFRTSSVY